MPKERYDSPLEQKKFNGHKLTQLANQSVTTSVTTITFDVESSSFRLLNLDTQKILQYSIDDGSNYLNILPYGNEDTLAIARTLKIRAAPGTSGSIAYDLQYTETR